MMMIIVIPRKNPILTHSISKMEKIRKSQPLRDATWCVALFWQVEEGAQIYCFEVRETNVLSPF